ncbi:hypothetical protein OROMI_015443 [Orobanche minor]
MDLEGGIYQNQLKCLGGLCRHWLIGVDFVDIVFALVAKLKSTLKQRVLLLLTLLGACMVIGDVFSAVSDVELAMAKEHHKYVEVPVACIVLITLFVLQHYGTHRVGFLFAPVVITWLLCISAIGLYNILYWNPHDYQALSPYYMYKFLKKTQRGGWMSLGGILLCITGSEVMFADLGHFSQLSIKIAFTSIVYPSLVLAYMGQAAYLSKHHDFQSNYRIGFYVSIPGLWPVLVIAVMAAVVGSQSIITGTFSIIKQCSALGCFPRIKIVHTLSKMHGQIYIPEINWILMVLCLAVTIGFQDTKRLGNASGPAVITVMLVMTCLMSLVIVLCWHHNVLLAICFVLFFGMIEALRFSASLIKLLEGAWVPIALALIFMMRFLVGHIGPREYCIYRCIVRYGYRDAHKDDVEFENDLVCSIAEYIRTGSTTSTTNGKDADIGGRRNEDMIVVRAPSTHLHGVQLREDDGVDAAHPDEPGTSELREIQSWRSSAKARKKKVRFVIPENLKIDRGAREELRDLMDAREAEVAYILGHSYVRAKKGSSLMKKMMINCGYGFFRRNCRSSSYGLSSPHSSTLEVGMVYHV